ncbi:MAG: permease [Tissierellia bacterium]|nr:permease [Tissierellia bacterium]
METLKKYTIFIIAALVIAITFVFDKPTGMEAVNTVAKSFKEMLFILPPVFILLGLLDVWVPRDTMVKFMGQGSGLKGFLLAFFLGSAAAGPLYVVFPIAAAFMKKDVSFFNIMILIGAWSTTKIPMLLFEYGALGPRFTLTRLAMNIPIIIIIAIAMKTLLSDSEVEAIYNTAKELN